MMMHGLANVKNEHTPPISAIILTQLTLVFKSQPALLLTL